MSCVTSVIIVLTCSTDYAGPGPAEGSGPHRYTLLVYRQPESFQPPANLSTAGTPLSTMLLRPYVEETGLGELVAANYIQVENGQATVSVSCSPFFPCPWLIAQVPATTAVNPSTVVAPSVSATASAASMSGASASMASGSASRASGSTGAAASTSSPAASAAPSNGANSQRQLGWTVGVGALGVAGAVIGAGLGF